MGKDVLRRDKTALVHELEQAGSQFKGNACRCPFHDDKHPSAGIYCDDVGVWRFRCQSASCGIGGDIFDIQARLRNTTPAEILKAGSPPKANAPKVYATLDELKAAMPGPVEAVHSYTNPTTGEIDMVVIRCMTPEGKTFRQCRPHAGGYVQQAPPKPWPLYNRARVRAADTVLVCEGESCVESLHGAGVVATTSPGGAGKAHLADWQPLAGKNCILWPDNDPQGRLHMQQVETILQSLEPSPRISMIEPADLDLQEKEDAADYIEQLDSIGICI